ncbi:MoxR family ATPase [Rivularia sp. UHCC 0363]|uniref:AAA family ATPase n=1 Tax=Rivularia sp. UHCC 0363 TaxID=3110244 RepID=UPI002B2013DC|nr:MoxR family ATPase [Rivularia sp. UHCC 0363]MEA5597383.1 MoxR family ATPase [Rivularia sp. UHCC 0363]
MSDWRIFQGTKSPHAGIEDLPLSPSWRRFETKQSRGATFQVRKEEIDLVNAALYLRRPLLVTGKPGTGKTSLAYAVARELELGEVLTWSVTTRTTLKDGLYNYDAIGRLQDAQSQGKDNVQNIGRYIRLGALGTAMLPSARPRALLIDEIDKSDIDLPNDLLHVFEEGEFLIPELQRIAQDYPSIEVGTAYSDDQELTAQDFTAEIQNGKVRCQSFPFVILTSNGERDFPPPFLRRCLRLDMKEPSQEDLERIVTVHLGELSEDAKALIGQFIERRNQGDLATDQLLNAIYLVTRDRAPEGQSRDDLVEQLFRYLTNA